MTQFSQIQPREQASCKPANRKAAYRMFIEGVREVLGAEVLSFLAADLDPENGKVKDAAGALLLSLEQTYGAAGGSGLTHRIGRAMFRYGVKELGEQMGFREMGFRILPSPRRVENGLRILSSLFGDITGQSVQVADQESSWTLSMACCPTAGTQSAGHLYAHLIMGLIQEFASWAGGGRYYLVTETACRMAGAPACVFRIDKKPLD